jgi:hypothetical protein
VYGKVGGCGLKPPPLRLQRGGFCGGFGEDEALLAEDAEL